MSLDFNKLTITENRTVKTTKEWIHVIALM